MITKIGTPGQPENDVAEHRTTPLSRGGAPAIAERESCWNAAVTVLPAPDCRPPSCAEGVASSHRGGFQDRSFSCLSVFIASLAAELRGSGCSIGLIVNGHSTAGRWRGNAGPAQPLNF